MKQFIFILFAFITLSAFGQTKEVIGGKDSDILNANGTLVRYMYFDGDVPQVFTFLSDIDSVAGTPAGTVTITKGLDRDNCTVAVGSHSWSTGVDTATYIYDTLRMPVVKISVVLGAGTQTTKYKFTGYAQDISK